MSTCDPNKKCIAILGGGLAGLTAAYYLSNTTELRDQYDVTVYQMGWRLGGKCASGRNVNIKHRIEEHGVHVFSGFYANAFGMLRDCYDVLQRSPESPVSSCIDGPNPAFVPHNRLSLMEKVNQRWQPWHIDFDPDASRRPGERTHTLWHDVKEVCRTIQHEYEHLSEQQKQELLTHAKPQSRLTQSTQQVLEKTGLKRPVEQQEALFESLDHIADLARPRRSRQRDRNVRGACSLLKGLIGFLRAALRYPDRLSDDVRHFSMLADLGLAIVRGILKHRVLQYGFDRLDAYDFADWLKKQGASPNVCDSPIVRALYASVFAYQPAGKHKERPRLAAGVAVRVLWRTFFDHRGGFVWKMQAGMGDAVIAPLYEVLKDRGVKFQFFHRVDQLVLSPDRKSIAAIAMSRQVTLKGDQYQPLLLPGQDDGIDVPSWPSEPRYDQLDDEQTAQLRELKRRHIDLESAWLQWDHDQQLTLKAGRDFHACVLAIPVGALKPLCQQLTGADRKWKQMINSIGTIQTQSVQLWLNRSTIELGWEPTVEEPLVVGYEKPLDSWVGMSQLIEREQWSAADNVWHIAYFIATASDEQPLEDQLRDPAVPAAQHQVVAERTRGFLEQEIFSLWPTANNGRAKSQAATFNWSILVDPSGASGPARLASQYVRANINPTDRYVLSLPGTTRYRLQPDQSGFDNLYLAGDWTRNGLNVGCAEAAVMSGMQAARGITQRALPVFGEHDPTLPFCRRRRKLLRGQS